MEREVEPSSVLLNRGYQLFPLGAKWEAGAKRLIPTKAARELGQVAGKENKSNRGILGLWWHADLRGI
jgi:hypothetical protein